MEKENRSQPFLCRYERKGAILPPAANAKYDRRRMLLVVDGVPAAQHPEFEAPGTRVTLIQNETRDDD